LTRIDSPAEVEAMCAAIFDKDGAQFCGEERERITDHTSSSGYHRHPKRCDVSSHEKKRKFLLPTNKDLFPIFLLPTPRKKDKRGFRFALAYT
jgi:hypothetical protein